MTLLSALNDEEILKELDSREGISEMEFELGRRLALALDAVTELYDYAETLESQVTVAEENLEEAEDALESFQAQGQAGN